MYGYMMNYQTQTAALNNNVFKEDYIDKLIRQAVSHYRTGVRETIFVLRKLW